MPEMNDEDGEAIFTEFKKKNGNGNATVVLRLLSDEDFLAAFVPPDFVIDCMLQRRFVYALTGSTGHAKTAIALAIAEMIAISDGYPTLGVHKVNKGRVLYLVGENPDDVRMRRIGANSKHNGASVRICYLPGVFNIGEMFEALRAAHAASTAILIW